MQKHALVILDPRHASARALCIRADDVREDADSLTFTRGARAVHVLPAAHVLETRWFADSLSANEALQRILSARAGAATFDVHESVAVVPGRQGAKRSRGSAVAEGVTVRVGEERVATSGPGSKRR